MSTMDELAETNIKREQIAKERQAARSAAFHEACVYLRRMRENGENDLRSPIHHFSWLSQQPEGTGLTEEDGY